MSASLRSLNVPGAGHNAPIPLGARVGPLICSSGISGKDPATGQLPADAATQVHLAFANMDALLAAGGATLAHVAKLHITVNDNAVRDAINAGATKTGVTIHVVDNGVDTGPKIAQRELEISPEDSEAELHERIKVIERELLVATVKQIAGKQIILSEIK